MIVCTIGSEGLGGSFRSGTGLSGFLSGSSAGLTTDGEGGGTTGFGFALGTGGDGSTGAMGVSGVADASTCGGDGAAGTLGSELDSTCAAVGLGLCTETWADTAFITSSM